VLLLLFSAAFPSLALAQPSPAAPEGKAVRAEQTQRLEKLAKQLTGATLVGKFTDNARPDAPLQTERYELALVKHLLGERWLFQARIVYGEHNVTIPLTLPVRWAGDTPVICVDKLSIPGLGTYTARVLIYNDHYAGFWSGATHGGHLFGTVERGKGPGPQE
jgi:hypothetical protein